MLIPDDNVSNNSSNNNNNDNNNNDNNNNGNNNDMSNNDNNDNNNSNNNDNNNNNNNIINNINEWVQSATLNDIVIDKQSNKIVAIQNLTMRQLSVAALRKFCVHHQITGYKNKSKEVTCALIVQHVRRKTNGDDNDDNNNDRDMSMVVDTGNENDEQTPEITSERMKERQEDSATVVLEQSKKVILVDTPKERQARRKELDLVRKEMQLSKLLVMHQQSLSNAREQLKKLKAFEGYDTDSSESREAKLCVRVLSTRYNITMQRLENHST